MAGGLRLNVYERALTEPRIRRVARKTGLSHFDVLGRLNYLWMLGYQRRTEFIDRTDADIATGELPGFVEALIAEQLADLESEQLIRVRGLQEAISYLEGQSAKGRKSGELRRQLSEELRNRTSVQQGLNLGIGAVEPTPEPRSDLISSDLLESEKSGRSHPQQNAQGAFSANGGLAEGTHPGKTRPGGANDLLERGKRFGPAPPEQAVQLARMLMDRIVRNHPTARIARGAPRLQMVTIDKWAIVIEKLFRIDSMHWTEIEQMIEWSQHHDFWRTVILGAESLRERWDQMASQMARPRARDEERLGPTERARREVEDLQAAAGSKP